MARAYGKERSGIGRCPFVTRSVSARRARPDGTISHRSSAENRAFQRLLKIRDKRALRTVAASATGAGRGWQVRTVAASATGAGLREKGGSSAGRDGVAADRVASCASLTAVTAPVAEAATVRGCYRTIVTLLRTVAGSTIVSSLL